jgi:hypothetical protein
MNKKLDIQFFAGILFLVLGAIALMNGIIQPSERSAFIGIIFLIAAALLLLTEDHNNNRRELKPVRIRARN